MRHPYDPAGLYPIPGLARYTKQGFGAIIVYHLSVHCTDEMSRHIMTNIRPRLACRPWIIALLAVAGVHCGTRAVTMLNMAVTLDDVAPGQPGKVGDVDRLRIVYDANAVEPHTKRVKLLNLQHFTGGQYIPPAPDPSVMPTDDAWLDLSSIPYRLHYKASVVHGRPIIIEFDENSRRLTIHPQNDPTASLESGLYRIDPEPAQH